MARLSGALSVLLLGLLTACGGDSTSTTSGGTGGVDGGAATGGVGGAAGAPGGAAGSGATAATGGSGGATGGSGGLAGSGGTGGTGGCASESDCPGVDTACRQRTCTTGSCGFVDADPGTACTESGGAVCDGAGNCVECNANGDCTSGVCVSHQCVSATCTDTTKNGDETDVDCGGSCAPCANGKQCTAPSDCDSGFCKPGGDGGAPDAGSSGPGVCTACASDTDCSGSPGTYCSSGKCEPKKTAGNSCNAANECVSGFCPSSDGVCCDAACSGTCQACTQAKTGTANGTCAPVTQGSDPDNECVATGAATCGVAGTGCNGSTTAPACNLYPSGTVCAAATCASGSATAASTCNGTGTCIQASPTACAPYACNSAGTACMTSCTSNANCAANAFCSSNVCTPKLGNGQTCSAASQCTSGNCVNGVCCNTACGGACDACNLAGNVGTCTPVASGQAGSPSCSPYLCNGSSATCPTSCSSSADCVATAYCSGNVCTPKLGNGQTCSAASQCTSGNCVDGVCCNSSCSGACNACNIAGSVGTCALTPAGQQGSPSCAPYMCNGSSSSCPTSCTTGADCASGSCLSGQCLTLCHARNDNTTLSSIVDNSNVFGLPFTPTATLNVRRIEIFTGNGPGTGQATIRLLANNAGQPGAVLAGGSFTVTAANGWQGADIPLTVLSSGTQYWFYYEGADGSWFPIGGTDIQPHWYSSNGGSTWSGPYSTQPWKYRLWCQP